MILRLDEIVNIRASWFCTSWEYGFASNVIETVIMYQDAMKLMQKQIDNQLVELQQLRPKPAKFKVGQIVVNSLGNSFTIRRVDQRASGHYEYTNSRSNCPASSTFVLESELRALTTIERGD